MRQRFSSLCLLLVCRICVQWDGLPGGLCPGHGGHPGNVMWPGRPLRACHLVQRRRCAGVNQPDAGGPEDAAHHQCVVRGLRRLLVSARPQQHAAQQLHHPGDRWEQRGGILNLQGEMGNCLYDRPVIAYELINRILTFLERLFRL